MALQLLFDNDLDPAAGTLTDRFSGATGFYIDAPDIDSEIEIDVFLQVYIATQDGEKPRNYKLGTLKDGEIKLNEIDTESIQSIPNEFIESGLEMAFFFLPSETIALEVWLVVPDCNLCLIDSKLNLLLEALETVQSDSFLDSVIDFAIENLLPQLLSSLVPGVSNALTGVLTDLLLPAILNALPGGDAPGLPNGVNDIALNGARVNFGSPQNNDNNGFRTRFT